MPSRRSYRKQTPVPYEPQKDYGRFFKENPDWHYAYTLMLIGLFFCIFTLAYAGHLTMVTAKDLSKFLVACCVIGMLIPWKYYRDRMQLENLEIFLFNLLGVGPILCSLMIWSNFLFHSNPQKKILQIEDQEILRDELPRMIVVYHLKDGIMNEFEEFRRFDLNQTNLKLLNADGMILETAEGGLGFGVVLENTPIFLKDLNAQ